MKAKHTYSDDELVALLKQGEKDAFTEIYNRFSRLLYVYAFKLTKETDAAKDMIQDVGHFWTNYSTMSSTFN